jgi:hypothetical protein
VPVSTARMCRHNACRCTPHDDPKRVQRRLVDLSGTSATPPTRPPLEGQLKRLPRLTFVAGGRDLPTWRTDACLPPAACRSRARARNARASVRPRHHEGRPSSARLKAPAAPRGSPTSTAIGSGARYQRPHEARPRRSGPARDSTGHSTISPGRLANDYDLSSFPRIDHRFAGSGDGCCLRVALGLRMCADRDRRSRADAG